MLALDWALAAIGSGALGAVGTAAVNVGTRRVTGAARSRHRPVPSPRAAPRAVPKPPPVVAAATVADRTSSVTAQLASRQLRRRRAGLIEEAADGFVASLRASQGR